jgi:hypothetical protein
MLDINYMKRKIYFYVITILVLTAGISCSLKDKNKSKTKIIRAKAIDDKKVMVYEVEKAIIFLETKDFIEILPGKRREGYLLLNSILKINSDTIFLHKLNNLDHNIIPVISAKEKETNVISDEFIGIINSSLIKLLERGKVNLISKYSGAVELDYKIYTEYYRSKIVGKGFQFKDGREFYGFTLINF